MFEHSMNPFHSGPAFDWCETNRNEFHIQYNTALNEFKAARVKGTIFRLFGKLINRRTLLLDLNEIKPGIKRHGSRGIIAPEHSGNRLKINYQHTIDLQELSVRLVNTPRLTEGFLLEMRMMEYRVPHH